MALQKRVVISAGVFVAVLLLLFGSLFVFESRSVPQVDNVATSIKGAVVNPDAVADTPLTTGQSKVTFTQLAKRYWVIAAVSVVGVLAVVISAVVLAVYLRNEEVGVTTPVPVPGDDPVKTDTDNVDGEWLIYLPLGYMAVLITAVVSVSIWISRPNLAVQGGSSSDSLKSSNQHSIKLLLFDSNGRPAGQIEKFSTTPTTIRDAFEIAQSCWHSSGTQRLFIQSPGLTVSGDALFHVKLIDESITTNNSLFAADDQFIWTFVMKEATKNAILVKWLYHAICLRALKEGDVRTKFGMTIVMPPHEIQRTQIVLFNNQATYSPKTPLTIAQAYQFVLWPENYSKMYHVNLSLIGYAVQEVEVIQEGFEQIIKEYQKQLASMQAP